MSHILVVGAGQAAASFAAKFRTLDKETPITLIGEEANIPYQRPPLSKKYATGDMAFAQICIRPQDWYDKNNITLQTSQNITAINITEKTAETQDGTIIPWTKLVFATGSRVRLLPDQVTQNLQGIHYIRTIEDADQFGSSLAAGKKVLIIGGGYIGLEAASVCASKGMNVTIVEAASRILQRVACAETSDWFRNLHQAQNVRFIEGVGLQQFSGKNGQIDKAILADGSQIDTDMAVIGIGILPNDDLAQQCGLAVDNGIIVDDHCRTNHPDIYAAGDCAVIQYKNQATRLESVPNATDQANIVAENIFGNDKIYQPKPWFWSDQYDVKLQIAGLNRGYDQVVTRAGSKPNSVAHFYYADNQLLAIDAMNEPKVYMIGKRILEAGLSITPTQAADSDFNLKSLL